LNPLGGLGTESRVFEVIGKSDSQRTIDITVPVDGTLRRLSGPVGPAT
jgi:hypothetical protein